MRQHLILELLLDHRKRSEFSKDPLTIGSQFPPNFSCPRTHTRLLMTEKQHAYQSRYRSDKRRHRL